MRVCHFGACVVHMQDVGVLARVLVHVYTCRVRTFLCWCLYCALLVCVVAVVVATVDIWQANGMRSFALVAVWRVPVCGVVVSSVRVCKCVRSRGRGRSSRGRRCGTGILIFC